MNTSRTVLLTGVTGNIGHSVAHLLRGHHVRALVRGDTDEVPPGIEPICSQLGDLPESLANDTEMIIHCAADTRFRAPLEDLRSTNVEGTAALLRFASRCRRLRKFVHVSTACVSGNTGGVIPEARLTKPTAFLNAYEQSKWEAEELVFESSLPAQIVRLGIVAGSEIDGQVRRQGALHHALFWLWRGLIPMMPGTAETPVHLISTEQAAGLIAAVAETDAVDHPVIHGCAGVAAPRLGELLDHLQARFARESAAWRTGSILPPAIVDAETFALFESTVRQSGDALFRRVSDDARSFLPSLLHPRVYGTRHAEALWLQPPSNWRDLTSHVLSHVINEHSQSRVRA
jgi:nucleoside-diphosphate-sugar epimerase